jgi:single-stranded DNA-specific DHH superfamily exonuclease
MTEQVFSITHTDRIKEFEAHLIKLDTKHPVCLLYDDDADGLCAGIVVKELLKKLEFSVIEKPKHEESNLFSKEFYNELKKEKVKTIICVDFEPVGWKLLDEKTLETLPFNLVIIDHHFNQTDLFDSIKQKAKKERIFIHPLNSSDSNNPSQYCCAKFTYDVCNLIQDLRHIEWKILPGMIGDMNVILWSEYIKKKASENSNPILSKKKTAFFDSPYGMFSNIVSYAAANSATQVQSVFESYEKAQQISDMDTLKEKYSKIDEAFQRLRKEYTQFAEHDKKSGMYFVEIPSDFELTSVLSSAVSYENPKKTFLFYKNNNKGFFHISARSQTGKIHLGKLLQSVSENFEKANGGGHIPAAGAICQEADLQAFKEEIKMRMNEFKL